MTNVKSKKVFIIGGTGSLGNALIRRLLPDNDVLVYSRDESKHWTIRNNNDSKKLSFAVGDIRDRSRIEESIRRFQPHIIIIAAALKQVDTCELSPYESIQTNVMGVKNVIDAVENCLPFNRELEAVLMVSTDKACAPVNVYGMCKAISERLVTAKGANYNSPKFIAVRYGNVLESRGSILPLFKHQAEKNPAFTLTHGDMTRFLMTLDESIDLIFTAVHKAKSGETWLPKLKAMKIKDLAEIFSERYKKPVKIIGMRPGEKIHEALICDAESGRVHDIGTHYVMSASYTDTPLDAKIFSYTSADDTMTKAELHAYLEELGIFEKTLNDFPGKATIEEIRKN